jgi:hypothetical protein
MKETEEIIHETFVIVGSFVILLLTASTAMKIVVAIFVWVVVMSNMQDLLRTKTVSIGDNVTLPSFGVLSVIGGNFIFSD